MHFVSVSCRCISLLCYSVDVHYAPCVTHGSAQRTLKHRPLYVATRPGAIPTPESESNDDSDCDSGVGIGVGIICSSFWWNRSRNRGDWNRNRSRNRGDWNRSWNRNQMTIPHIYVHVPSNIHSGSNPQET